MQLIRIGLVDTTGTIDASTLAAVAGAINIQVTRDLPQYWAVPPAIVGWVPAGMPIPPDIWAVKLVSSIEPGSGGYHMAADGRPFALVLVTPGRTEWIVDTSHEIVEMLVDPGGNRLQPSTAIHIAGGDVQDTTGQFLYLVEACDPCETELCTYRIGDIPVSDFITPHFYDPCWMPGMRYSFTGALQRPRQIPLGGYISWVDPQRRTLQQILRLDAHGPPLARSLGMPTGASLRHFVERATLPHVHKHRRFTAPSSPRPGLPPA